jgi:hypothetical protein
MSASSPGEEADVASLSCRPQDYFWRFPNNLSLTSTAIQPFILLSSVNISILAS